MTYEELCDELGVANDSNAELTADLKHVDAQLKKSREATQNSRKLLIRTVRLLHNYDNVDTASDARHWTQERREFLKLPEVQFTDNELDAATAESVSAPSKTCWDTCLDPGALGHSDSCPDKP